MAIAAIPSNTLVNSRRHTLIIYLHIASCAYCWTCSAIFLGLRLFDHENLPKYKNSRTGCFKALLNNWRYLVLSLKHTKLICSLFNAIERVLQWLNVTHPTSREFLKMLLEYPRHPDVPTMLFKMESLFNETNTFRLDLAQEYCIFQCWMSEK